MEKYPFFSIILPTYNREKYIATAINSVIEQSFKEWELIIIDDGSTDNTFNIISNFNDKRIIYIYQNNFERSIARNNGINNSKGQYICFLDSDDRYCSDILEKLHNFLKSKNFPQNTFMFFDAIITDENNTSFQKTNYKYFIGPPENYIFANSIGTVQVCISKALLKEEQFNPNITIGEDKELWLRIVNNLKPQIYYLSEVGVKVIEHNNRTVFIGNKDAVFGHLKTLKYILKQPYAKKISKFIIRKVISNAYMKIGYHFSHHKYYKKALKWYLKSLIIAPKYRTKEKIYLIINSSPIRFFFIKSKNY